MSGAEIPEATRQRVTEAAQNRCGYCLSPQHLVMGKLEIEHILPRAKGGDDGESNLWLGHSAIVLTLDTYSHVLPTMQQQATARLEKMLYSNRGSKQKNTA